MQERRLLSSSPIPCEAFTPSTLLRSSGLFSKFCPMLKVWMVLNFPSIFGYCYPLFKFLGTVLSEPIAIGITVTCIFRVKIFVYLISFLIFTLWSYRTAKYTRRQHLKKIVQRLVFWLLLRDPIVVRIDPFSLLIFSFRSLVRVFLSAISPVCSLKYPYSCFSSHFGSLVFVIFVGFCS